MLGYAIDVDAPPDEVRDGLRAAIGPGGWIHGCELPDGFALRGQSSREPFHLRVTLRADGAGTRVEARIRPNPVFLVVWPTLVAAAIAAIWAGAEPRWWAYSVFAIATWNAALVAWQLRKLRVALACVARGSP
jgi:hypothetical protein